MPFSRPLSALGTEVVYDSGDYAMLLDKALARIGWEALQAECKRRRAAGELVGPASACFVEKGGLGPADGTARQRRHHGAVELVTGGSSVGQGFETAMAQICAETLGVDYRAGHASCYGQTDRIADGIGAHASRASVMTGGATHVAAVKLRAKALDIAAELLQARRTSSTSSTASWCSATGPAAPRSRSARSRAIWRRTRRRLATRPGLAAEGRFRTDHMTYPVRRAHRASPGRSRNRGGDGRALPRRLRYRPRDQPDDGRRPDRRRLRAGARRRAVRGIPSTTSAASRSASPSPTTCCRRRARCRASTCC